MKTLVHGTRTTSFSDDPPMLSWLFGNCTDILHHWSSPKSCGGAGLGPRGSGPLRCNVGSFWTLTTPSPLVMTLLDVCGVGVARGVASFGGMCGPIPCAWAPLTFSARLHASPSTMRASALRDGALRIDELLNMNQVPPKYSSWRSTRSAKG